MPLPEKFVLFDTEFTSWEGAMARNWSGPGEYREVIQIGAIRVDKLQEAGSFCVYVKPIKNPELSAFIKELTGISQETVDKEGKPLGEALSGFKDFVGDLPAY
ncbi:MAG: 3'-5' exonuclease, partial [Patescibacteria group bacterium]